MECTTCFFTGHRSIPKNKKAVLEKRLESEIINLIGQGARYFGTGGSLGFDTMAALTVLKLKEAYPHIRLILVLPCKEHEKFWNEDEKKIYNQILEGADKVVYCSEKYYSGCMQKRNRRLADYSGACVCYLTNMKSGTAYTVGYARKKGLRIINLA